MPPRADPGFKEAGNHRYRHGRDEPCERLRMKELYGIESTLTSAYRHKAIKDLLTLRYLTAVKTGGAPAGLIRTFK